MVEFLEAWHQTVGENEKVLLVFRDFLPRNFKSLRRFGAGQGEGAKDKV
ncbi:hypothetical protein HMPREF9999_01074 [Alloprevotella sp. oral taxon 473 str. F0040]|nr:hypothetical protein HMPREF9999_01074 [Alloprevotella sp. oral taxon 473 str. F0040]